MQSPVLLLAAAIALFASSANAEGCDALKVAKLIATPSVVKCTASTGLIPGQKPSMAVIAKVCGDSDCESAIAAMKAENLGDCTITGVAVQSELITPIEKYCSRASGSDSASGSVGSMSDSSDSNDNTPSPSSTPSAQETVAPGLTPIPTPTSAATSAVAGVSATFALVAGVVAAANIV